MKRGAHLPKEGIQPVSHLLRGGIYMELTWSALSIIHLEMRDG